MTTILEKSHYLEFDANNVVTVELMPLELSCRLFKHYWAREWTDNRSKTSQIRIPKSCLLIRYSAQYVRERLGRLTQDNIVESPLC